jgi:NADPH-dependent 2,4-dienoyl-CoA reductase/sulfur reductase-like enzyme
MCCGRWPTLSTCAALATARWAAVVGAGFIGLEFAAAARKRGVEVAVLEAAERPMARALSPAISRQLAGAHRDMGTDLRLGEGLTAFRGSGGTVVTAVGTSGHEYPADLVILGVGVRPATSSPGPGVVRLGVPRPHLAAGDVGGVVGPWSVGRGRTGGGLPVPWSRVVL